MSPQNCSLETRQLCHQRSLHEAATECWLFSVKGETLALVSSLLTKSETWSGLGCEPSAVNIHSSLENEYLVLKVELGGTAQLLLPPNICSISHSSFSISYIGLFSQRIYYVLDLCICLLVLLQCTTIIAEHFFLSLIFKFYIPIFRNCLEHSRCSINIIQ